MTSETLFINSEPLRFKIIRPVYETLTVNDAEAEYFEPTKTISSSAQVISLFDFLSRETREHFWVVHLDGKNRMLSLDPVSTGSLNASIVHPREVFKSVLLSSAAALLLIHNHPSGNRRYPENRSKVFLNY
jgi:DNA repair protein RadC